MRISEFLGKVIFPVGAAIFLAALFYPVCVDIGGRCNRGCDPDLASGAGSILSCKRHWFGYPLAGRKTCCVIGTVALQGNKWRQKNE